MLLMQIVIIIIIVRTNIIIDNTINIDTNGNNINITAQQQ